MEKVLSQENLRLEVDDSVPPVKMPVRKPPLPLREKYKNELERLCSINVITPMTETSDWISSTVIVPKQNGDIRLCIDPKSLPSWDYRRCSTRAVQSTTVLCYWCKKRILALSAAGRYQ